MYKRQVEYYGGHLDHHFINLKHGYNVHGMHSYGNPDARVARGTLKHIKKCDADCDTCADDEFRRTHKYNPKTGQHEKIKESVDVFKKTSGTLPPVKQAKDREPLLDKIRRVIKKRRLGLKENFRRAADHEHSMAQRYLDDAPDGQHLAIKNIGVHDKKGHIHVHYAMKGRVGGGRYVVLNKHGEEMKMKKGKKK